MNQLKAAPYRNHWNINCQTSRTFA